MPRQFQDSTLIQAPADLVWRALVEPQEVVQWDGAVEAPEHVTMPYPRPGQHARWRYRLGPLRVTLHDLPMEVEPERRFRSRIRVGPFHIDELYRLEAEGEGATRLTLSMAVWTGVALVGPVLDVLLAGRVARGGVSSTLRALKAHCEARRRTERLAAASTPAVEAGAAAAEGEGEAPAPEAVASEPASGEGG